MGLVDAVACVVRSDEGDEETFAYRCTDCETAFEEPRDRMRRIRCPDCGSGDVRAAD